MRKLSVANGVIRRQPLQPAVISKCKAAGVGVGSMNPSAVANRARCTSTNRTLCASVEAVSTAHTTLPAAP